MQFKDPYGAHRRAGIPVVGGRWRDTEVAGDDIAGMVFQDCVLERVRMVGSSLWETMFVNCRLDDCEFADCRLFRTQCIDCSGSGLRVAGGEFTETAFSGCRFEELVLQGSGNQVVLGSCEVEHLVFGGDGSRQRGLTLSDCELRDVAAEGAEWDSATAVGVDFSAWSMPGAAFEKCMLVHATAPGLDFSDVRFSSCNLYKSDLRKARLRQAPGSIFAESDCTESDFSEAELEGALFANTVATRARFVGAKLGGAMFPDSKLIGADFRGAAARESVWIGSDLTDASLEGVDAYRSTFRNAVFSRTDVDRACFAEADLHGVNAELTGADLRGARGTTDWRAQREATVRDFRQSAA